MWLLENAESKKIELTMWSPLTRLLYFITWLALDSLFNLKSWLIELDVYTRWGPIHTLFLKLVKLKSMFTKFIISRLFDS